MLFILTSVKYIGVGNLNGLYSMEGRPLEVVHEERDLGVIIVKDLKCDKYCVNVAKAANMILGMIKRTFAEEIIV